MATRRSAHLSVSIGLVLIGLLLLTGCQTLDVLGDSITWMSADAIHHELDDRYTVLVDGRIGVTIHESQEVAEQMAATHPWAIVVNLGSNDAGSNSAIVSDFDTLIAVFEPPTCRLAVTLTTGGMTSDWLANASLLNEHIRWEAWFGSWRLVDWDDALTKYSALGQPFGPMVVGDHVHPTAIGEKWLAQQIDEALAGCPS